MYCLYQTSNFANPERPSFRVCHSKLVNIKYLKSKRAALKNHKRILKVGSTSIYIYIQCAWVKVKYPLNTQQRY